MIIDFHTHTGGRKVDCTLDDIGKSMAANEIDKSVVFPVTQNHDGGVVQESIKNLETKDGRFVFFLRFDPNKIDLNAFKDIYSKFSGFKLHPRGERFDPLDNRFEDFFRLIESSRKPVIIHSRKENYSYSDPDRLIDLAGMYPKINFVFGHFADDSEVFFEKLCRLENAFVETSIVSSPRIIEMRARKIGADRILFGSDFPFSDQEIELLKIKKSRLSDQEKEKILYKNAQGLLGL